MTTNHQRVTEGFQIVTEVLAAFVAVSYTPGMATSGEIRASCGAFRQSARDELSAAAGPGTG